MAIKKTDKIALMIKNKHIVDDCKKLQAIYAKAQKGPLDKKDVNWLHNGIGRNY